MVACLRFAVFAQSDRLLRIQFQPLASSTVKKPRLRYFNEYILRPENFQKSFGAKGICLVQGLSNVRTKNNFRLLEQINRNSKYPHKALMPQILKYKETKAVEFGHR